VTLAESEPIWVPSTVVQAIHADQIRQHGGTLGIRDQCLLESALQRAPNHWHYEPSVDLPLLAALYGIGVAQNHPFLDGNKRTAFQVMYVFLGLNDLRILASEAEVVRIMLEVANGVLGEDALASWLREHTELRG
jgi:death-on-curing protein